MCLTKHILQREITYPLAHSPKSLQQLQLICVKPFAASPTSMAGTQMFGAVLAAFEGVHSQEPRIRSIAKNQALTLLYGIQISQAAP